MTPNEAASYLQVSRPYVMKLISDKVLYAHKVGAHNKVHLKDVVALKNSWSNDIKIKSEKIKKGLDRFIQDEGGSIVAIGTPLEVSKFKKSLTAKYLANFF